MAAYLVVDIEVTNPEAYEEYRSQVPPLVAKFGSVADITYAVAVQVNEHRGAAVAD